MQKLCLATIFIFTSAAFGQAPAFPQGTWTLQTYGAYTAGKHFYEEQLPSVGFGFGYYVFNNASINAELSGYHVTQTGEDAEAINLQLLLRHHFIDAGKLTIFADVGPGAFYATEQVPIGGTNFNITFRSGLGATYHLRENMYLFGGARYFHLSNAALEGRENNPSINGLEGYVGLMWRL